MAFCNICHGAIMAMSKKFPEVEPDGVWLNDKPVCNACVRKLGEEKS